MWFIINNDNGDFFQDGKQPDRKLIIRALEAMMSKLELAESAPFYASGYLGGANPTLRAPYFMAPKLVGENRDNFFGLN